VARECCDRDPNAWERSLTLFASWKRFAERSGQFVGDTKTFRAKLECCDGIYFKQERHTKRAGFQGLRLRSAEEVPPERDPYYDR
jgi:putative DNA primase/helicase